MPDSLVDKICILNSENKSILLQAMERLALSTSVCSRILKVSRTIADMEGSLGLKEIIYSKPYNIEI